MTAVTVPGGNGTPFNLNFNTTDNTAFQNTLLSSFAATFASTNLYTSLNPSTPSSNPTVPNIFVVSPTLNASITGATITLAPGFNGVSNTATGNSTIAGNSGINQSIVSGSGNMTLLCRQGGIRLSRGGGRQQHLLRPLGRRRQLDPGL